MRQIIELSCCTAFQKGIIIAYHNIRCVRFILLTLIYLIIFYMYYFVYSIVMDVIKFTRTPVIPARTHAQHKNNPTKINIFLQL